MNPVIRTLTLAALSISSLFADTPPNVVLIMTDDQGYGDLSITGNKIVETPHMDELATSGAWLKQFYVSPVCTPTRANLMTGRYAYRTKAFDTYLGRANMEPDEVTLPEILSEAGYATGIFGKWHLGDYYPTRAMDQGFQEALVHQGGGLRQPANPPEGDRYHDPILFHNGVPKRYEGYCTDIYFDEAAKYITQQAKAKKPFFAYIATNAPHGPFDEPPTRELFEHFQAKLPNDKKGRTAAFYSMIKNVDNNIGRLTKTLDELGISENTLVIFLTDNGPAGGGCAGPFRGAKAQIYQGGIRTVCFLKWPGTIEAGSGVSFNTAHIDLFPTILDICGAAPPKEIKIDGRNVRPLLSEKGQMKAQAWPDRHLFFQWHRGDVPVRYHHFAVIDPQGQWKLLNRSSPGKHTLPDSGPKFELYNLHKDIGEENDLAAQNPKIVADLKAKYDAWFDEVCSSREPNFGMPPIVIGSEKQATVVLTPQDKRADQPDGQGWQAPGHFPTDLTRTGPYTIQVRLTEEVAEETQVELSLEIGDSTWKETVTVFRGLHTSAIGKVTFPKTGQGIFRARVSGESGKAKVYQVTIK